MWGCSGTTWGMGAVPLGSWRSSMPEQLTGGVLSAWAAHPRRGPGRAASDPSQLQGGQGAPQDPTTSGTRGCSLSPAVLPVLPLPCPLLPRSQVLLFMGSQKGEEIFLPLVCFTPSLPSVHPGPQSLGFLESCGFGLSGMLFWARLVWAGGLAHRPARAVGAMCLFKLISFLLQKC